MAKTFWDRVEARCKELDMPLSKVILKIQDLTGTRYRLYEAKSRNTMPDLYTLAIFSRVLDVSTDWLLGSPRGVEIRTCSLNEWELLKIYRSSYKAQRFFDDAIELLSGR